MRSSADGSEPSAKLANSLPKINASSAKALRRAWSIVLVLRMRSSGRARKMSEQPSARHLARPQIFGRPRKMEGDAAVRRTITHAITTSTCAVESGRRCTPPE